MKKKPLLSLFLILTITINCEKNPPKVTRIITKPVESFSYTTATVKGVIIDNSGNVSDYGHCWNTTNPPTVSNSKTSKGGTAGVLEFSSELTGLTAATKYYVRAYAIDGNTPVYSEEVVNFTTEAYNLPLLTTNTITEETYTTATGGGYISSDGGSPVTSRGICWATTENPTISGNKTTDGSGTGSFTSNITGLTAGTTYYVWAYATNGVGTAYGNQQNFKTIAYGLPSLTTTTPSAITYNSASSGGNISSDGGTPVTARGVCWSTSAQPTIANSKTNDGDNTGIFTSNLSGLSGNTDYYVRAYATNSIGTAYGSQQYFKTKESPYITVSSPVAQNHWIIGNNYNINWSDNINENVTIKLFKEDQIVTEIVGNPGIPSNGVYLWTIGTTLTYSENYKIRITSATNETIYGESPLFIISNEFGTATDLDGNIYKTIKIGNQWWMAENLRVLQYPYAKSIPLITDNTTWAALSDNGTDDACCYYENSNTNKNTYGVLYTWAAAMGDNAISSSANPSGVQGVCPTGWHLPSDAEWKVLEKYLGMSQADADATNWRGTDVGSKLKEKGTLHWLAPNTGASNESGFFALPGGGRSASNGTFISLIYSGFWWSTTECSSIYAWNRHLSYEKQGVYRYDYYYKSNGFSVRCVKN